MKKVFSIILVLMLLCGMLAVPVSAAGNGSLSMTSASGGRGETVTLSVKLNSNPGLVTMSIRISYDTNVLELENVSATGLLGGGDGLNTDPKNYKSPYNMSWMDYSATSDNTKTGAIATFTFKIKDNAPIGDSKVTLTFLDSYTSDYAENTFTASSGKVTVVCKNHDYSSWTKADDTNHQKECSICGDTQKATHDWSGTVTKEPSCKETGEKTYTCSVCTGTKIETLDKTTDHKYGDWVNTSATEHTHTCSVCQGTEAKAHTWDGGKETKPATCKETGVMTYTCTATGCGATYTEDIPVTDKHTFGNLVSVDDTYHKDVCSVCKKDITEKHSYDSGKETKPATCKEPGVMTYTCSGCQHTKTTEIPKTEDHKYGAWQNADGENHKHVCSVCQKEETAVHTWNKGAVTQKPTCKETGVKTYTCTGCSATYTEDIPKTEDHKFGAWTKVDAATHSRTCSVCEKVETEDHGYKTSWSKDKNEHWHACSGCGDKIDVAAHTPGKEATEKNPQVCTVCNYVIKPALGHTHNWDTELTTDENGHWYACSGCEEKKDEASHDFENACDGLCETCGHTRETAHSFGEQWVSDATGHWYACTVCGEKSDFAEHAPGAEATETTAQTCTACGYEVVAALGHSFSETWSTDADSHWHDCQCGEKEGLEPHSWDEGVEGDEGIVYTCTVCGYSRTEPKSFNWIWIVIGVVAVAAVAVVAVIVIKKKK